MTSAAFSTNELWTLGIAAYAAVVSTFVLGWDAYKWLAAGAKVDLTAYNVGDRPTTITNLGGMYFESWWRAYILRRKPAQAFIITEPSQAQRMPYRFEVGDQWIGLADQTEDVVQMAKNGYLFFILYTTSGGRGHRVRLRFRAKDKEKI